MVEVGSVEGSFAFRTAFGKYIAISEDYQLVYIDEVNIYSSWFINGNNWTNDYYSAWDNNAKFSGDIDGWYIFREKQSRIIVHLNIMIFTDTNKGHALSYEDNGDGTHKVICSECGVIDESEECYGDNDICVGCCGQFGEDLIAYSADDKKDE